MLVVACLALAQAAAAVGGEPPLRWRVVQGQFRIAGGHVTHVGSDAAVAVLEGRRLGDFVLEAELVRPRKGQVAISFRRQGEAAWAGGYYLNSLRPGHLLIGKKRGGQYEPPIFDASHVAALGAPWPAPPAA